MIARVLLFAGCTGVIVSAVPPYDVSNMVWFVLGIGFICWGMWKFINSKE